MTRRGITFGELPETARPVEAVPSRTDVQERIRRAAQATNARHHEAEQARQREQFRGLRTTMRGGLVCRSAATGEPYGEIVECSITRPQTAIDVTTFGDAHGRYMMRSDGQATARARLLGDQLPSVGDIVQIGRGTRTSFSGVVRSVTCDAPDSGQAWSCEVYLEEL